MHHRNIVRRGLEKAIAATSVPHLSWHDLRHVFVAAFPAHADLREPRHLDSMLTGMSIHGLPGSGDRIRRERSGARLCETRDTVPPPATDDGRIVVARHPLRTTQLAGGQGTP